MSIFQTLSADSNFNNRSISQTRLALRPDQVLPTWLVSWVEAGAVNGLNVALPLEKLIQTPLNNNSNLVLELFKSKFIIEGKDFRDEFDNQ